MLRVTSACRWRSFFYFIFFFCTREFAGSSADSVFSRLTSPSAANSVSMETVEGRRGEKETTGGRKRRRWGRHDVDFLTHSVPWDANCQQVCAFHASVLKCAPCARVFSPTRLKGDGCVRGKFFQFSACALVVVVGVCARVRWFSLACVAQTIMAASYQLPELKAERLSVLVKLAPPLCVKESPLLWDGMREFFTFLQNGNVHSCCCSSRCLCCGVQGTNRNFGFVGSRVFVIHCWALKVCRELGGGRVYLTF